MNEQNELLIDKKHRLDGKCNRKTKNGVCNCSYEHLVYQIYMLKTEDYE